MIKKKALLEIDLLKELGVGTPPEGFIIRRINAEQDQQGMFTRCDPDGGMVLLSIVDPVQGEFISEAGIIRRLPDDKVYIYNDRFARDPLSDEAFAIIRAWTLYQKHTELQAAINRFVITAYAPSQIILYKELDCLSRLFVPVQQKFHIGRFEEKINWNKVRKERFKERLTVMQPGEHITYLALVPQIKSYTAAFYSVGTKPHYETHLCLQGEPFNFIPSHGGHIRALRMEKKRRCFLVDAGSAYKGKGKQTLFITAKEVVTALKKLYPEFDYTPIEGRGAFGSDQSY